MMHTDFSRLPLIFRKDYCHGFVGALCEYLREAPSLFLFGLCCQDDDSISAVDFQSICNALSYALTLRIVCLEGIRIQGMNVEGAHEILTSSILHPSASITDIDIDSMDPATPGDVSLDILSRSFRRHSAIQNSEMTFRIGPNFNGQPEQTSVGPPSTLVETKTDTDG